MTDKKVEQRGYAPKKSPQKGKVSVTNGYQPTTSEVKPRKPPPKKK